MNANQPNQPQASQTQSINTPNFTQNPVEPPTPKKKTPWLLISIIVLLLSAIGVLGYKYYELQQKVYELQQPAPKPSPQLVVSSPSPVVSSNTEADSMEGWKTYNNKEYKYSIKYPDNWTIKETSETSTTELFEPGTELKYIGLSSPKDDFYLGFGIRYLNQDKVRLTSRTGVAAGDLVDGTTFTLGEYQIPVQHLVWEGKVKDILGKHTTINNNYNVYLEFSYFTESVDDHLKIDLIKTPEYQLVKQILSTFKFIN